MRTSEGLGTYFPRGERIPGIPRMVVGLEAADVCDELTQSTQSYRLLNSGLLLRG